MLAGVLGKRHPKGAHCKRVAALVVVACVLVRVADRILSIRLTLVGESAPSMSA
jgi:hypothetical protein